MSRTIELLSAQHGDVLEILDETEAALAAGTADVRALVRHLRGDVDLHFVLEEVALFPLLARHPQLARGPVAVMESEHGLLRRLIERCAGALELGDDRGASATAAAIVDLLRVHIAKEERVLFPLALRVLGAPERNELEKLAEEVLARAAGAGEDLLVPLHDSPAESQAKLLQHP
jgi:hemerythrin-like domain-containing protein